MLEEDTIIYMMRRSEPEKHLGEESFVLRNQPACVRRSRQVSGGVTIHPSLPITEGVLRTWDFQC